jgi:hypothetical protein
VGRRYAFYVLLSGAAAGCIAWLTGPGGFDIMDGSEFVICGSNLNLSHPPGYPLYIFLLRTFSMAFSFTNADYSFFRVLTATIGGTAVIAAFYAIRSLRCGRAGALAGSLLFITIGPILDQLNIVEVHGFAILLVLVAIALRNSRSGPYFFSLSIFAGHPLSALFLPSAISERFKQRWVLFALLPLSLWLFVPIRSAFQALCHYSYPENASLFTDYLTLYGSKIAAPSLIGLDALFRGAGAVSLVAVTVFIVYSGKWLWGPFITALAGLFFLSCYSIPDTGSMLWLILLPLSLWASFGLDRMLNGGKYRRAAALMLLVASILSGISLADRSGDNAAPIIAADLVRGAGCDAVFVSTGMTTFHTAYLLEIEDRRPDILPMDSFRCFFRIPPPSDLPGSISGRTVYATRGWNQTALSLSGLLFSDEPGTVNWSSYDIFSYDGEVHDRFTSDEIAELWARRAIQTASESDRRSFEEQALRMARSRIASERIRDIIERY